MKKCSLILTLLLLITVGCGSKEPTTTNNDTKVAAATNNTASVNDPSQTAKNYFEAVRGRHYSEVRDLLSQRSITNLTDAANRANSNLDQMLKRAIDRDAQELADNGATNFETRNEDIRGDRATVEAKATNAPQWARISLVKEDNNWKINIDETSPVE
ncbi:MAG: hypothetical protein AB1489_01085 [Acidobacteriota bacterium]